MRRDFNMEPEELMQAQELEELGAAVVVAPREPAHEQGGKWRELSYCLVHKALVGRVQECEADHRGLEGGHRAVSTVLRGKAPKRSGESSQKQGKASPRHADSM